MSGIRKTLSKEAKKQLDKLLARKGTKSTTKTGATRVRNAQNRVASKEFTAEKQEQNMAARKRKEARKKSTTKATQSNVRFSNKRTSEVEGARLDPETGGSVSVARQVGTRGEKVTRGSSSMNNFRTDQAASARRLGREAPAKKAVRIETAMRDGKPVTEAEKKWLKKYEAAGEDAARRQSGNTSATRAVKRKNAKLRKERRKKETNEIDPKTGEIKGNPTKQQEKAAIRNAEARNKSPKEREKEAYIESQDPANRGLSHGKQRKTGSPSIVGHRSRSEERKTGGKVSRRAIGGSIVKKALKKFNEKKNLVKPSKNRAERDADADIDRQEKAAKLLEARKRREAREKKNLDALNKKNVRADARKMDAKELKEAIKNRDKNRKAYGGKVVKRASGGRIGVGKALRGHGCVR